MRGKRFLWKLFIVMFLASMTHTSVPVTSSPAVTFKVDPPITPGVPVGPYGVVTVNVSIEADPGTAVVGWMISIKVDPDVLKPGFTYEGEEYIVWTGTPGYFLYDWCAANNWDPQPGTPRTSIIIGSKNITAGTITGTAEFIKRWAYLGVGNGTEGTGTLATFFFTSLNETAHSPIEITEAYYCTSWKPPDDPDCRTPDLIINGHYNVPLEHDVAVTAVSAPPEARVGDLVPIDVSVWNLGANAETFNLEVSANTTLIETRSVSLASGASGMESFTWNTRGVAPDRYTITAEAILDEDVNPNNNLMTKSIDVKPPPPHDIAVVSVTPSPTLVVEGELVNITVIIKNKGTENETNFNVKVYYDDTALETKTVPTLETGANISLTFTWDTTDVGEGTHTVIAEATPVHGETDTEDNTLQSDEVVTVQARAIYIRADGSVDPPTAPISSVDNVTYTFTDNIFDFIVVERDNIVVDGAGYTLQGTGTGKGIYLLKRNNVTITNVEVKAFSEGIYLWNSSNNNLSMNSITNGYFGILLGCSSNNSISGNNVRLSTQPTPDDGGIGVAILYSSSYNTVFGNNIENTFVGIQLQSSSNNNIVSGNNVKNNYYGIAVSVSSNYNNVSRNTVTSGRGGIHLERCSNNTVSGNNITENDSNGIILYPQALNNVLYKNHIVSNHRGITLWEASYNSIYNNNFINNNQQVYIITSSHANFWDNGYPSGGNYWSDHVTVDDCCGVNQDEPGSDGIVDEPYVIDDYNRDNYPLVKPWSPIVSATIGIDPDTLNLRSMGEWITCYIELPEGYNVSDIDIYSIKLNNTFPVSLLPNPPVPVPTEIGDYDDDDIPDLMVKFNMTELTSYIYDDLGIKYGNVTLTITGMVDGTPFEGEDTVKVLIPGDLDHDGDVDWSDFNLFCASYPTFPPDVPIVLEADLERDGDVDGDDFILFCGYYGMKL